MSGLGEPRAPARYHRETSRDHSIVEIGRCASRGHPDRSGTPLPNREELSSLGPSSRAPRGSSGRHPEVIGDHSEVSALGRRFKNVRHNLSRFRHRSPSVSFRSRFSPFLLLPSPPPVPGNHDLNNDEDTRHDGQTVLDTRLRADLPRRSPQQAKPAAHYPATAPSSFDERKAIYLSFLPCSLLLLAVHSVEPSIVFLYCI